MIYSLFFRMLDVFLWLSLWILLSGGFYFSGVFFQANVIAELVTSRWSLLCVPFLIYLALKIFSDKNFILSDWLERFSFFRVFKSLGGRMFAGTKSQDFFVYFYLLLTAFIHCGASWNRYFSFNSGWDLAIYTQACSNGMYSHLRDHTSLMADHFEPILFLFTPFCSVLNGALVLLFAQAVAPSLGGVAIYKLAKTWEDGASSPTLTSILFPLSFLLLTDVQTMLNYDFHPYVFSLATIPWMLYAARTGKQILFWILVGLHFSLKENTSLFLMGFFALLFLERREFKNFPKVLSGMGFVLSVLGFILVMKVIFPYYRGGGDSQYFAKYFPYLGQTMSEFMFNFLTSPHLWMQRLLGVQELKYLSYFFFLFFWLFKRPLFLIPLVPVVFMNTLSTSDFLKSRSFHYDAEIMAWFFSAMVMLWPKLLNGLNFNLKSRVLVLWGIFVFVFAFSDSPVARMNRYHPDKQDLLLYQGLQKIRKRYEDCTMATTDVLVAALSQHPKLSLMNEYQSADTIVVAFPKGEKSWSYTTEEFRNKILPHAQTLEKVERPLTYDNNFLVYSSCQRIKE